MLQKSLQVISVLVLPIILTLLSLDLVAFNDNYYHKAFAKYDVYKTVDAQKEVVDREAQNILNYIQDKEKLEETLLNDKEKMHLGDVKSLVTRGQQILIVALFLWIACFIFVKQKKKILSYGSMLTVALVILIALVNFESLFFQFHLLVFDNDLWMLNPVTDNLIKMYPEGMFQELGQRTGMHTLIAAMILVVASNSFIKNKKSRK